MTEMYRLLRHQCHLTAIARYIEFPDVHAVKRDLADKGVIESLEHLDSRGFSATRRPDQGDTALCQPSSQEPIGDPLGARPHIDGEIAQDPDAGSRRVPEVNTLKSDSPPHLVRIQVDSLGGERINFRHVVEKAEDRRCCRVRFRGVWHKCENVARLDAREDLCESVVVPGTAADVPRR